MSSQPLPLPKLSSSKHVCASAHRGGSLLAARLHEKCPGVFRMYSSKFGSHALFSVPATHP